MRILRTLYFMDLNRLGTISIKDETKQEIRKVLDAYYGEYLGVEFKAKRFLKQMNKFKGNI